MHSRIHPDDIDAIAREVCRAGSGVPDDRFLNAPCRRYSRGATYFALWSAASGDLEAVALTPDYTGERLFVQANEDEPYWWVVSAYGRSIIQNSALTINPSRESALSAAPAISRARLRVKWNNPGGGSVRDFTIGAGVQYAVYGCGVSATILAPPQVTWGPRSSTNEVTVVPSFAGGTAVTESVAVEMNRGISPLGVATAHLVDTVQLAGGAGALIPVPPGARVVTLSQPGAAGLATGAFIFGTLSAVIEPVIMDATARTVRIRVPSHATDLAITGADALILTAIWEID